MSKKKKIFSLIIAFIILVSLMAEYKIDRNVSNDFGYSSNNGKQEEYYMVTFLSGIEYWKNCIKGFQAGGKLYDVKTVYTGGLQYDINQEITAFEEVVAKKPAGIAISCMNPDAFKIPINKAIAAGIPVVTFDADSPQSKRYSFFATGNNYAGKVAAGALSDEIGKDGGEVAIITLPSQLNHVDRVKGFKEALSKKYKKLKLVQIGNGKGDEAEAAKVLSGFLQTHPNLKGVFCTDATSGVGAATAVKEAGKVGKVKIVSFDTDKGTLDAIKSGIISASIAQGTYLMGYQSMRYLYQIKHQFINKIDGQNKNGIKQLPSFVDTGVNIVTKSNVNSFY